MARKLLLRNIFGKPVKVAGSDSGSVEQVASLPDTGKTGVIYYNTTDKKYYVYDETKGFTEISRSSIPILDTAKHTYWYPDSDGGKVLPVYEGTNVDGNSDDDDVPSDVVSLEANRDEQGFYLKPNVFYDLGTINSTSQGSGSDIVYGGLRLYCVDDSYTELKEYMGRFTVSGDSFSLYVIASKVFSSAPTSIHITVPEDIPDFEDGHTYEFNISANVLAIKDITAGSI